MGQWTIQMIYEWQFFEHNSGSSVIFDDDGRVAYAYLLSSEGHIVADVWLYNHCQPPGEPEWETTGNMPFANSIDYVEEDENFRPVTDVEDITVSWDYQTNNTIPTAFIFIRGALFAILINGSKPGWSRLAKKNGPLAKVLPNKNIMNP